MQDQSDDIRPMCPIDIHRHIPTHGCGCEGRYTESLPLQPLQYLQSKQNPMVIRHLSRRLASQAKDGNSNQQPQHAHMKTLQWLPNVKKHLLLYHKVSQQAYSIQYRKQLSLCRNNGCWKQSNAVLILIRSVVEASCIESVQIPFVLQHVKTTLHVH